MKPIRVVLLTVAFGALMAFAAHWAGRLVSHPGPVWVQDQRQAPFEPEDVQEDTALNARTPSKPNTPRPSKKPAADGPAPVVTHTPAQPKTGQPVLLTARLKNVQGPADLALEYQVVEPGQYIALKDAAFEKRWTTVPMNDRGAPPDKAAGDGEFTAQLPGEVQKHRRLIRYRIRSHDGKIVAPDSADPQPNYAYFVYDGVPPWKGAINPKAQDRKLRQPVTFSSQELQRVPVYHLIGSKSSVEKATWSQNDGFGGARNQYQFTGTLVYDGVVYDHVGYRARGGSWRHAMGKNMWKFNFLPGHRFQARDFYGNPYQAKWDKLNLGACIQQGDYGMRGEQGMFEALGFKLFNLAGAEGPLTHWVHFRIIDEPEESPADQYSGDFWGLYLAVENVDGHFLKEHDLPEGNVYKMEFGAKTAFNGNPAVQDQSDVQDFMRHTGRGQSSDAWLRDNADLARYYDYRSILECIHHYDIDSGKNYFYYLNPQSRKWAVIPWDIDLSWGDQMFGGGHEPFYRMGVLSRAPFKQQYQERLAEIRDLLFNPEQTGKLLDEHAAMIWNPNGDPSLVDADRAKWDYNPVMVSHRVMSMKARQGLFYFGDPHNTFKEMVKYMKGYAAQRSKWVDNRLLAGYRPPPAPVIASPSNLESSAATLPVRLQSEPPDRSRPCQWRLAEVTDPSSRSFDPAQPWKYEIEALWTGTSPSSEGANIPANSLRPGHTYRIRARWQDSDQGWSRWSAPIQFVAPAR